MKRNDRMNSRQQIQFGFKVIIASIAIMLAIILAGVFSMKYIQIKLQEAFIFSNKIKQLEADETRLSLLMLELTGQCDEQQKDIKLRETLLAEEAVNKNLVEIVMMSDGIETELKQLLEQIRLNTERSKGINQQIRQFCSSNNAEAAMEIYNRESNSMATQSQMLVLQLDRLSTLKMEKLGSFASIVLNSSLISLLIVGLIQILVAIRISKGIMAIFGKILKEIRDGVMVVGTSTAEIQTTVSEISTGAAETSTAIAETTTTMEEIRQTSLLANQKANSLNDSSQKAYEYAEKGLESSHQMIEAIQKIESHMMLISNTIQRLAEQNRSIGEITSTVSDIADQSNLLAVNAAIEAAKAGEHGRGFTVVAQEIRSLSEQSKKSTAQVREILNEIQKSVHEAVDVIRQGSETVNMGSKLVHTDRQIVELLTETVEQALEASIQIASSSQQQMAGMDQIVPAMENIRLASEQNLMGIRQAELAAKDINMLGTNLNELMDRYKF
jgi:hypothetical protein